MFPFQTLDLCLPAKTQDKEEGVGDRCGQNGKTEDGERSLGYDGFRKLSFCHSQTATHARKWAYKSSHS